MVKRHLSIPHDFICFTDRPVEGINCWKPPCNLPGWWGKLGFFKPLEINYPILYLDLDVIITGSLDDLFNGEDFCTIAQWKFIRAPQTVPGYNTSAMLFSRPGYVSRVWEDFKPDVMNVFRGDQDWLKALYPDMPTWPRSWFCSSEQCSNEFPTSKIVLCNVMGNYTTMAAFAWARKSWR